MNFILHKDSPASQERVIIEISAPLFADGETSCVIRIAGLPPIRPVIGEDPLNCLEAAIMFVRTYLDGFDRPLFWETGQPYESLS